MIKNANYFVSNIDDDLHCYQASLRMVWHELLGYDPGLEAMDRFTDFHEGEQTWPFAGWLAAADAGLRVTDVEDFDAAGFVRDPISEVKRQARGDENLVRHILTVSDISRQAAFVKQCLSHPNILVERRIPSRREVAAAFQKADSQCICSVNYHLLAGSSGYTGHAVVVTDLVEDLVCFQDPGLPPERDREVPIGKFYEALSSPTEHMSNITIFEKAGHHEQAKP